MSRVTFDIDAEMSRIIKSRMAYMGMDAKHLARRMNVCEKTIGKYIRKPSEMTVHTFRQMSTILHINSDDVMAWIL